MLWRNETFRKVLLDEISFFSRHCVVREARSINVQEFQLISRLLIRASITIVSKATRSEACRGGRGGE